MLDMYTAALLPLALWRRERHGYRREEAFYAEHTGWPGSDLWRQMTRRWCK